MLPKSKRLDRAAFNEVFSKGKRYHDSFFTLIYTPAADFHAAVVVGKKVYQGAVLRNRLRRQLYDVVYRFKQKENLKGRYVIIVKPHVKNNAKTTLAGSLGVLLMRIKS